MRISCFVRSFVAAATVCTAMVTLPGVPARARVVPIGSISVLQDVLPDGGSNRAVEIAHNPDRDEYLAVWRTHVTFGPGAIYAVVLDAGGQPTGQPVVLADNEGRDSDVLTPGGTNWRPDVSYNSVSKQYLVTIQRNFVEERNAGILGILVSDAGARVSDEISINTPQGDSPGCVSYFPDAVADPVTGGWKLVYARQDGTCPGLADAAASAVIQSLGPDLERGPSVSVPVRSAYRIDPRIAHNPVTNTFIVATTTHESPASASKGYAHLYDSTLVQIGGSIEIPVAPVTADPNANLIPIADPVSGNWILMHNSGKFGPRHMGVLRSTGEAVGDAPVVERGNISAVSAIGDGTVLVSNTQGPLQQLRQDGTEIHWIPGPLATGNVSIPNASVANGDPDNAGAASIGLEPTTGKTASRGVRLVAPGPLPLVPARLLDTRPGEVTVDSEFAGGGRQSAGSVFTLQVGGRGGVPVRASAAFLNVAAASPAVGFVTTYPCDASSRPTTSNLNYAAGGAASAAAITKLSTTGTVCIYTSADAHLIVDVTGFVPERASVTPLVPARLLDTRNGNPTVDNESQGIGRLEAGSTTTLSVAGRGGVPDTADAVIATVIAIRPETRAFLTIYPCDAERPRAASLNAAAGDNVANLVTSKVSAAGTICIYNSATTDLAVDVAAYVPEGGGLLPIIPTRLVDTRTEPGSVTIDGDDEGGGRLGAGVTTQYRITRADIAQGATGVLLNVAAIRPESGGFLTASPSPCADATPSSANVNFTAGSVVSNAVFVKVGGPAPDGYICIYTSTATDITIDAVAYTLDT